MKNLTKALSVILTIALVMSVVILPAASVSAAEGDFIEGFAAATADNLNNNTYGNGWKIVGTTGDESLVKSVSNGVVQIGSAGYDLTNVNGQNLNKSLTKKLFDTPVTSGIYEFSYDMTLSDGAWTSVTVDSNEEHITAARYTGDVEIASHTILNSVKGDSLYVWKDGKKFFEYGKQRIGKITQETKINVKSIVNLNKKTASTWVWQNGELRSSVLHFGLGNDVKNNGLAYLSFSVAQGTADISNVSMTKLPDDTNAFYGFIDEFLSDNAATNDEYAIKQKGMPAWYGTRDAMGWGNSGDTHSAAAYDDVVDPGNRVLKVTPNAASKTNGNYEGMALATRFRTVSGGNLKGKYEVSFRTRVDSNMMAFSVGGNHDATVKIDEDAGKVGYYCYNANRSGNGLAHGSMVASYTTGEWVNVKAYFDTYNGKWRFIVTDDNGTVLERSVMDLDEETKKNGITRLWFRMFGYAANDPATAFYIDDVKVIPVETFDNIILEDDFSDSNVNAFFGAVANTNTTIANDTGTLKITAADWGGVARDERTNGTSQVSGRIKMTTKIKLESGAVSITMKGNDNDKSNVQLNTRLNVNKSTIGMERQQTGSENKDDYIQVLDDTFEENEWYKLAVTVDTVRLLWWTELLDVNTGAVIKTSERIPVTAADGFRGFDHIMIRAFQTNSGTINFWLDDFKLEYVPAAPELATADSITATDAFGINYTMSNTTGVSPSLQTLKLDFGVDMTDISGITLTKKDGGNAPNITPVINDSNKAICDITLSGALENNTDYVLTIPATVKSANYGTLGKEVKWQFRTGEVHGGADLKGLAIGEGTVSTLNDLTAGATVTVNSSAYNASSQDMKLTYLVAYYKDINLDKVEKIERTLKPGKALIEMPTFKVPADMTDITEHSC